MDRESVSTMREATQRGTDREQAERRIGKGEQPWREEAGVQSVVDAVRDLTFPTDKKTIERSAGDRVVVVSGTSERPLRELLPKLKEDRFETIGDFQTAVMRHWEGIRYLDVPQEQRPPEGGGRPRQAPKRSGSTKAQCKANQRRAGKVGVRRVKRGTRKTIGRRTTRKTTTRAGRQRTAAKKGTRTARR